MHAVCADKISVTEKGWTQNSIQDFVGIRMFFGQAMNGMTMMVIKKQSRSPLLIY